VLNRLELRTGLCKVHIDTVL